MKSKIIVFLTACLLLAFGAPAAVPANSSGAYYGVGQQAGWLCHFRFSELDSNHIDMRGQCVDPLGFLREGATTLLATCITPAFQLQPGIIGISGTQNVSFRFLGVLPGDIACPGGRLTVSTNGHVETWCRVKPIATAPYDCQGQGFSKPRDR